MSHESSPKRVLTDSIRVGIFCRLIGMMLFPIQEDIHEAVVHRQTVTRPNVEMRPLCHSSHVTPLAESIEYP